jgi:hypothetical protein
LKRVSNLESPIRTQCSFQSALWLGIEGVELDDALTFAGEQGWVENAPADTIRLTDAGHAAGKAA